MTRSEKEDILSQISSLKERTKFLEEQLEKTLANSESAIALIGQIQVMVEVLVKYQKNEKHQ